MNLTAIKLFHDFSLLSCSILLQRNEDSCLCLDNISKPNGKALIWWYNCTTVVLPAALLRWWAVLLCFNEPPVGRYFIVRYIIIVTQYLISIYQTLSVSSCKHCSILKTYPHYYIIIVVIVELWTSPMMIMPHYSKSLMMQSKGNIGGVIKR